MQTDKTVAALKTSLEHLPQEKQEQILEITSVIEDVAKPEKIILFGSYAKGNYVEHRYVGRDGTKYEYISDYDFLVVTEKNTLKEYELEDAVNSKTSKVRPDINIQLHTIDYINEGLEFGQYFFSDIVTEGVLLYDSGNSLFSVPRALTKQEQQSIAERYFKTWYYNGVEFLIDAENAIRRQSFKKAAFELHQATENFYSSVLLVLTGYKPKSHNLIKLRKHAKSLSEELFLIFPIETNKEIKAEFDLLKKGYIDARYKLDYEIKEIEILHLFAKLEEMKTVVHKICINKINSLIE